MRPKGSGNIWQWEVSMAQLVLQSRPFLKRYVTCILREITWLQGSLKGYKLQQRINGRIIYRNRGCIWDLSKFPIVTSMGILLCIFRWNSIWNNYHTHCAITDCTAIHVVCHYRSHRNTRSVPLQIAPQYTQCAITDRTAIHAVCHYRSHRNTRSVPLQIAP
jgi:hypothetical protein